ncbi:MAG: B12-binding domain-containing radical SAM protein, partial [Candidatus Scalindua sp.]|nr:B12-binding domain-containing radical SAM protein [Candidatus Scalindua sp.]
MKSKAYLIDMGTRMNMNMLPLASGLISSFAMADDVIKGEYDIDIQFIRRPIRELVNELKHPKIIGISLYVWNLKATLNYAKLIKALHPDVIIVAGGYSVPKDKERIKKFYLDNPYIDILVHGEGEITFSEILKSTIDNKDYSKIDGITYKGSSSGTGAEFVTTKKRGRIADLNQIPSPFLNGVFDMLINKYGSQITGTVWETNRGCPYSCSFCDWGYSDTNSIYKHDLNRLYEELKWISKNKIHWIFGADGNFGIFYKRDYQIAEWVSDLCKKTSCPKFFIINWLKNSHERIVNIAEILEKGGVTSNVTLSIQSLNSETLKAIKRKNIKSENYNQIKAELHKRKTPTVVELILGLPLESYETFVNGLEKIMTASLYNHFAIYICSILENTEMSKEYYREKYGIITKECPVGMSKTSFDTDFIETEEYIIGTATMPVDDWGKSYIYGYLATVLYNHRVCFYIMNYIK